MSDDVSTQQQPGFWRRFLALKTLLVTFSMVALLASNVVCLVSADAHDFMHSALLRVLLIGGQPFADRAMSNSPKQKFDQVINEKTADLDARNKRLTDANKLQAKQLEEIHVQKQKLAHQLDANGKQAKATVAAVHTRLDRGMKRSLAALPAEPIPFLGLIVTLALTSLDIYDACQTEVVRRI